MPQQNFLPIFIVIVETVNWGTLFGQLTTDTVSDMTLRFRIALLNLIFITRLEMAIAKMADSQLAIRLNPI